MIMTNKNAPIVAIIDVVAHDIDALRNVDISKMNTTQLIAHYNNVQRALNNDHIDVVAFNGTNGALRARIHNLTRVSNGTTRREMSNATQISIVDIARDMNIDAKRARAKLRRMYSRDDNNELPKIISRENWIVSRDDEQKMRDLLSR
jgi:hypothetical protein